MARNRKDNSTLPTQWVLFAVLLVVSLVCTALYSREGDEGFLHRTQAAFNEITAPLQLAGSTIGAAGDDASDAVDNMLADDATLTALREQNAELIELVTQAEEYRLEALRLQELLNLKDTYGIEGVSGRVIGRSTDAWNQTITIDVGSDDGVETGMTVMGASGVVGQTISTSPGSATVRLITDPQSGAAALLQASRVEGIVRGSLDGLLYLENVDADAVVNVGDVVLTSGMGGSYTKGLLIGTVVRVDGKMGDSTRTIIVSPNDTAQALEEVLVVFSAATENSSRVTAPVSTEEGGDE